MTGKTTTGPRWLARLLGHGCRFSATEMVPGVFPAAQLDALATGIRQTARRRGTVHCGEHELLWQSSSDVESIMVRLSAGDGGTRVQAEARYEGLAAIAYFACSFSILFLAAAVGGFVLGVRSPGSALAVAVPGVAVAWLASRVIWRRLAVPRQQELVHVAQTTAQQVTALAASSGPG